MCDAGVKGSSVQLKVLKIDRTWIGGTAEDHDAFIRTRQEGRKGVCAHIGIHGHGIRAVTVEGLAGVHFCGRPDIAALGVENHRYARIRVVNVGNGQFKIVFAPGGGVVGDLWFVSTHQICRAVYNGAIKIKKRSVVAAKAIRNLVQVGIEAHAKQRIVFLPEGIQFINESHCKYLPHDPPCGAFRDAQTVGSTRVIQHMTIR